MRSKLEVADIFRRHGDTFRAAQGNRLSLDQRKVMAAIEACRTSALGGHVERCEDCGEIRVAYNSCRDRHCPKCQGLARLQWLADRRAELLPVAYFHVVFTVPSPIAAIALQNKALVYDILFKAAALEGSSVQHARGKIEFVGKLKGPLLSERSGADHEKSALSLGPKLTKHNPRLDRLSQANLIGEQHTLRKGRIKRKKGRFDLVRIEIDCGVEQRQ